MTVLVEGDGIIQFLLLLMLIHQFQLTASAE